MADNSSSQSSLILGMKPKTFALATAGAVVAATLGYAVYFDHKRRNDPEVRKQMKRERKKVKKAAKAAEDEAKQGKLKLIDYVLDAVAKETLPATAEEKEKYFMTQVAAGEQLCNAGEAYYNDAVLPFFKALKVYPAPLELIMIYQKTVPEPVFQTVVQLMALEQNKRQAKFYEEFPPKETHVRLGELPAGETPEHKPIVRRGLVANEDLKDGQTIYTETPLVSGLHPALEGEYCNYCLRKVPEDKVTCSNCDKVAFCSAECEKVATENYHRYLCTNNKPQEGEADVSNKELAFFEYTKENNVKYSSMIAKFLSTMVAEEMERTRNGQSSDSTFNSWDHIDRFRYLDTSATENTKREIEMLKEMLGTKVQGINEFLTDEIYLMLKGKMLFNAYGVNIGEDVVVSESSEHMRKTSNDKKPVGAALYKISTYIGQSEAEPNVKVVFGDNHDISVVALKDISKDTELLASYSLPVPV